jgi:hypothetical protein
MGFSVKPRATRPSSVLFLPSWSPSLHMLTNVSLQVILCQTSSKFSLRIRLDKRTLSDHRNSVKLQALSFSHWDPYPAAMRPWERVKPT